MGAMRAPEAPAGVPVLVAVRDVAAGVVLHADDVEVRDWPDGLAPPHRLSKAPEAVGHAVTIPLLAGEPVTAGRVVAPGALGGLSGHDVATSIPGVDPAIVEAVRAGDHIDILAPGTGDTVAHDALVLVDPPRGSPDTAPTSADASLLVAVSTDEARALARLRTDLDVGSLVVVLPRTLP
jgi:Flp pilus assembly protein CpaB